MWRKDIQHRDLKYYMCAAHCCTCYPRCEVYDMASNGSHGDFIPLCSAEYLQGTVVGVQG